MEELRIRKLTPRECFRLMGLKDEDITKVMEHQTNASSYHLAGDSIVTTCLMAIFGELLDIDWKEKKPNPNGEINVVGTYQFAKSDNFMQGKDRFQKGKEVADTLLTNPKEGVVVEVLNNEEQ